MQSLESSLMLAVLEIFIAGTYNNHPLYLYGEEEAPPATSVAVRKWQDKQFGMFIRWEPVRLKGTEIGWSRGKQVSKKQICRLNSGFLFVKAIQRINLEGYQASLSSSS